MHRFEGTAERVGERAKQFQTLGVDAGLGFAAEALIAVKSKPDRLRTLPFISKVHDKQK